jgi:hypothetical protein
MRDRSHVPFVVLASTALAWVLSSSTAFAQCATNEDCTDSDGIACTVATCGEGGVCSETDACTEICRGAGFWAEHSGTERGGENIGQDVLDQTGPMVICGQSISLSDQTGSLDSIVEALCVRTAGVQERDLFRQLLTASLNCSISEGGTCDDITGRFIDVSFDECNLTCAGDVVENGPTIDDCIAQLACFNRGGRLVGGECATGTCATAPEQLCGGEFELCPTVGANEPPAEGPGHGQGHAYGHGKKSSISTRASNNAEHEKNHGRDGTNTGTGSTGGDIGGNDVLGGGDQVVGDPNCVPFEDSCATEALCNTELDTQAQICPEIRKASSGRVCKQARQNVCTIDLCL